MPLTNFPEAGRSWTANLYALFRVSLGAVAMFTCLALAVNSAGKTPTSYLVPALLSGMGAGLALGFRRFCGTALLAGAVLGLTAALCSHVGLWAMLWVLGTSIVIPSGEALSRNYRPGWRLPSWVFQGSWICLWILCAVKGGLTLATLASSSSRGWMLATWPGTTSPWGFSIACAVSVVELTFFPLCLSTRGAQLGWTLLAACRIGMLFTPGFRLEGLGFLLLHAMTFVPSWIPPARLPAPVIVFFDGVCLLCNRFVDFVIEEDPDKKIRFAALQGSAGAVVRNAATNAGVDSVIVSTGELVLVRAGAVLAVLQGLGGAWRALAICLLPVPIAWLDRIYRTIAARRYRWFGKTETCRAPSPDIVDRFID